MKTIRWVLFFCLTLLMGGAQVTSSAPLSPSQSSFSPRARVTAPYVPSTADQIRDALRLKYRSVQHDRTPITSREAQAHTATWTVMIYMAADNDLEPFAIGDINEMEFVGSTTDVNVLVQLDRSPDYNSSNGDWTDTRRLFITQDTSLAQIASENVDNLGETNTGNPATLVDFTNWAVRTYPADHYALIIWDHGGSWYGVASDESSDYDELSLPELTQALQQTVNDTGIEQFDVIGFDACLMGALEVYQAVAPYAEYGVGSAELIPGNGWDYFGAFDALSSTPTMDGEAFGRAAVDSFEDFYTNVVTSYTVFSLGVVDLSQSNKVVEALDEFTTQVNIQPDTAVDVIGNARRETHVFGAFDDPQFTDVWAATDLLQFMELVASQSADPALQVAANSAHLAGQDMMLYYKSSETLQGSGGLSIYFPRSSSNFYENNREERYLQEVPSALRLWPNFLGQFYTLAAQFTSTGIQNTLLGVAADGPQAVVSVQAVKNSLVDSSVLVLLDIGRGQRIIVDYHRLEAETPDSADSTMNSTKFDARARRQDKAPQTVLWAATVPYLSDSNAQLPVLLLRSRYNENTAIINGVVHLQDGPPINAQLVVDLTTNQVTSVWGIRNVNGTPMPAEILVQPGDLFQPTWFILGKNNDITATPAHIKLVFSDNPLFIVWKSAPPGAYTFVTLAEGIGSGEVTQDSLGIAVTETGSDEIVLFEIDPNDPDIDDDGVLNEADNCPVLVNPQQEDGDGDGTGDVCDLFNDQDADQDGILDVNDNCPTVANPDQQDTDGNGVGDACQATSDMDGDGIVDNLDNCPADYNQYQSDYDGDGMGDACDPPPAPDRDADGIADNVDNCPEIPNTDQTDNDQDGLGDACDTLGDADQDGILDSQDNCPNAPNADQIDYDHDGIGDACDGSVVALDGDGDGVADDADNCRYTANSAQEDQDDDGVGDVCDNCPGAYNMEQTDGNQNGQGDACEVSVPPTPSPYYDIAVSISAPGSVNSGSSLTYAINVQNVGNQPVDSIIIHHIISFDLFGPSFSTSQGTYDGTVGSDYLWDVGSLAPGASATLTVAGMVSSMDVVVDASLVNASADENSANDAVNQTIYVTFGDATAEARWIPPFELLPSSPLSVLVG